MLVLAAPRAEDPRDGGAVHTFPGELLFRPYVCDAGEEDACPCSQRWAGMSTGKTTTLAEVVDRDMTRADYITTLAAYFVGEWDWERGDAEEEARELADIAAEFGAGALLAIDGETVGRLEIPR